MLKQISEAVWEIPKEGTMNVPGRVYGIESVAKAMEGGRTLGQLRNVAALPGIQKYALVMPDGHEGYGFPIGGVAAFDLETGVVSPGGVGYDINCLKPGTKVLCELGYSVMIEQIGETLEIAANSNGFEMAFVKSGLQVKTMGAGGAAKVLAFMKKKADRRTLRLKTNCGLEIECSEDHPIFTQEGMVAAGLLEKGGQVGISFFNGIEYEKSEFENEQEIGIIAKVFGYMLGDGSLTEYKGKYCMRAYGKEEDMLGMCSDLAQIGVNSSTANIERQHKIKTEYGEKEFTGKTCELRIYSKEFAQKLLAFGFPLGRKTDKGTRVPQWIMKAPLWVARLFLAGFFGAELSSPKTHSKTGFYAPTLAQNKNASFEADGRLFLIDIMQLLEKFGVKTTTISSAHAHPNKQGEVVRLRLQIGAEEENLLALWRKVGFEYNGKRKMLSEIACKYILQKKKLQERRSAIATHVKELKAKGLTLREAQSLLAKDGIANDRFIERHYYEDAGQRITLAFASFEEFVKDNEIGYLKFGMLFDAVEEAEEIKYEGEVYDINVETTHNFVANGIVVSNCGVRLIATPLPIAQVRSKLRELVDLLFKNVPSGVGSKGKLRLEEREFDTAITEGANWAIAKGYGFAEDAKHCEENGCIDGADPTVVSPMAKKRGRPQFGTVGAGNHFVEIQEVQEVVNPDVAKVFGLQKGNACIMIHTGSRGFGHQVCDDNLRTMLEAAHKYRINLPDRELCCAPINSPEAQNYLKAMRCAVNFAFCNRQVMTHWVRETFGSVFGKSTMDDMKLVYDVCHNIAKFEEHEIDGQRKTVCVHRKGATRAFAPGRKEIPQAYREVGQPVLIPGSMGTASYVLVGKQEGMNQTFGSTCHGAGRVMSRSKAVHSWKGTDVQARLMSKSIIVKATEPELIAEEAPEAYKNVDDVVKSVETAGISGIVARLIPIGVVKG